MIRRYLLEGIVVSFVVIGTIDISHGNFRIGIASILLGIINGLLLTGDR